MLKGAICLLACFAFLFGCATKTVSPPLPSLPQYEPEPLSERKVLDEEEVESIEGSAVMPGVGKKGEIAEKKESSDSLLTPESSLPLPDLTITDLFFNPKKRLAVTIANLGNGSFPMEVGNLRIFVNGQLKRTYPLSSVSDRPSLQSKESIHFTTSLRFPGRHEVEAYVETSREVRELNKENNSLKKVLEGLPVGPDITIKELDLTEDLELSIIISNAGDVDLRKGVTFRTQVFLNGLKVSEFDHFTSEILRANSANQYPINPPYRVGISGTAEVKVSVLPKLPSDDVWLENNILERTFIIFPFRMVSQTSQEFSFYVPSLHHKEEGETERVKAEARWEGGTFLMLSFSGPEQFKGLPILSGKSPLKVEVPIHFEDLQKESLWRVAVVNLVDMRVEGHLIIQHP